MRRETNNPSSKRSCRRTPPNLPQMRLSEHKLECYPTAGICTSCCPHNLIVAKLSNALRELRSITIKHVLREEKFCARPSWSSNENSSHGTTDCLHAAVRLCTPTIDCRSIPKGFQRTPPRRLQPLQNASKAPPRWVCEVRNLENHVF